MESKPLLDCPFCDSTNSVEINATVALGDSNSWYFQKKISCSCGASFVEILSYSEHCAKTTETCEKILEERLVKKWNRRRGL